MGFLSLPAAFIRGQALAILILVIWDNISGNGYIFMVLWFIFKNSQPVLLGQEVHKISQDLKFWILQIDDILQYLILEGHKPQ